MITILLAISILLAFGFIIYAVIRKGELPDSISAMVYTLPKGGAQWLWTIWLWTVGATTFIPLIGIMNSINLGILPFAALVCIAFTGAWPLFQQETKRWHYVSAILCGILSQMCIVIIYPELTSFWIIYLVSFCKPQFRTKDVFIAESICYLTTQMSTIVYFF